MMENESLRLRFDTSDENLVADIVSNICTSDYDASNLNHVFLPSLLAKIRDGVQKLILRSVSNLTAAGWSCLFAPKTDQFCPRCLSLLAEE